MKIFIRSAVILLSLLVYGSIAQAQPKAGSVLLSGFEAQPGVVQIATVIAVNGKEFTCRFSQTNSEYVFSADPVNGIAKVVRSKGGKFSKGSTFYYSEYFIVDDTYGCLANKKTYTDVIVKFGDGKAFLGSLTGSFTAEGNFEIMFWHSGNKYVFDKDNVVVSKTGGAYAAGTAAKIFCASAAYDAPEGLKLPPQLEQKRNKRQ